MARKTYNEKLKSPGDLPKIEDLSSNPKFVERYQATTMLIAEPMQYHTIIEKLPTGKIITTDILRAHLAKRAGAGVTCPLTAGIFVNICAHAAIERGDTAFPWWRVLKAKGELNEKYPEGIDGQKLRLEADGFTVEQKGKRYFVKDYKRHMWECEA